MIAKIIVWAPNRNAAISLAKRVLASTTILGVGTNQEFLGRCLSHPGFLDKNYTTGFIDMYSPDLFPLSLEDERIAIQTSIFLKYCADMERQRTGGAFKSISSSFRVQTMDRANVKADHITIGQKTYMVQYLPQRGTTDTVRVWEIKEQKVNDKTKGRFLNKNGGMLVHRYYSAVTPPEKVRMMDVSIVQASLRRQGKVVDEWIEGDITFQIDGVVKTVFVATEGDWRNRDDAAQIVWIHVPELCAGIKSTRRSLLTFAGRLDERTTGSAAELGI
jgi:acetyl/propionyl-CoA carboxylase alpha subunit